MLSVRCLNYVLICDERDRQTRRFSLRARLFESRLDPKRHKQGLVN
jgi:hypothetical protein